MPVAGIDDEQDDVGRSIAASICSSTCLRQVVAVLDADAAGIDQLEEPAVVLHQVRDAVARHAGLVIDDRNPPPGQPIEQARLAHVRAADDDNLRNGHEAAEAGKRLRGEQAGETCMIVRWTGSRRVAGGTFDSRLRCPILLNAAQARFGSENVTCARSRSIARCGPDSAGPAAREPAARRRSADSAACRRRPLLQPAADARAASPARQRVRQYHVLRRPGKPPASEPPMPRAKPAAALAPPYALAHQPALSQPICPTRPPTASNCSTT